MVIIKLKDKSRTNLSINPVDFLKLVRLSHYVTL